ncbi:MAG TPA: DUF2332 domain-containing protein [Ktedonobacterales bacterium]|nr:DUF2332 domain-containing protein [Ktedonobacterales bacterium]
MAQDHPTIPLDVLARRFVRFAEQEAEPAFSPLYARLCRSIATDPDVLVLAAETPPSQPAPNLLLGAVHYLLLKGVDDPLAAFYPSLSSSPDPGEASPAFHRFCLEYAQDIRELLLTRRVQTNEVARSACLLPMFELVARQGGGIPLSLIEIGASAGLNLLWDRYGYDYANGRRCGVADSPLQIPCDLKGDLLPPLPTSLPEIAFRLGIDLYPLDISDDDAVLWLRALIWPEHHERVERLQQALEIARAQRPTVLAGDALNLLPEVIAEAPPETTLCIFHSLTLYQFSAEQRERLTSLLLEFSRQRPIFRIAFEKIRGADPPQLCLFSYIQGTETARVLADCSAHGRWLEWLV